MALDGARRRVRLKAPDRVQQLLLAEHPRRGAGELDEQLVLQRAQLDALAVEDHRASHGVDRQRADLDRPAAPGGTLAAAQNRSQARPQLDVARRTGEKVIGPRLEGAQHVHLVPSW